MSEKTFRHDIPCGGRNACLYGLPDGDVELGEVVSCKDCGRTWVGLGGLWIRRETGSERRCRLGIRWWQRTPPWNSEND